MIKNKLHIGTLAILLSIGLTGSVFAGVNYSSELDEYDVAAEGQGLYDASDYKVNRSYRPATVQNKILIVDVERETGSSELDAIDYAEMTPTFNSQSDINDSKSVHCADFDSTVTKEQMRDCG